MSLQFRAFSDNSDDFLTVVDRDAFFTNITLCWLTGTVQTKSGMRCRLLTDAVEKGFDSIVVSLDAAFTPSMHVDEKSDEAILPRKRPNKGWRHLAEVVEGRASPKGDSRQAAVVRTLRRVTPRPARPSCDETLPQKLRPWS
jgi:hypothetical protein